MKAKPNNKQSRTLPRWRKVYPLLWRNPEFRQLGPSEKLVALYLLCGEQTNRIGLFPFSFGKASEDTGIDGETFRQRFANVVDGMGWKFDNVASVVFIPSWWKWNPPENPNVLIGNLDDRVDLPKTPLSAEFAMNSGTLSEGLVQTFKERLANVSLIKSKEQEQELSSTNSCPTAVERVPDEPGDAAEEIYQAYPKKVGHGKAIKEISSCLKALRKRGLPPGGGRWKDWLLARTVAYAKSRAEIVRRDYAEIRFTPHPSTWFHQGRFDDDDAEWRAGVRGGVPNVPSEQAQAAFKEQDKARVQRSCDVTAYLSSLEVSKVDLLISEFKQSRRIVGDITQGNGQFRDWVYDRIKQEVTA